MSWIRKPGQFYGELQGWWGLFVAIPGAGALVSAISSYAAHAPIYLILFYASGIFCFLVLAVDRVSSFVRDNAIFGKLQMIGFNPNFGFDPAHDNRRLVNCFAIVQNRSKYDIYYSCKTVDLSLDGHTFPPGTNVDDSVMVIPAGGAVQIGFASIWELEPKVMSGQIKVKLTYGRKADALTYTWEVFGEPQISIALDSDGKPKGVNGSIKFKDVKFS